MTMVAQIVLVDKDSSQERKHNGGGKRRGGKKSARKKIGESTNTETNPESPSGSKNHRKKSGKGNLRKVVEKR